MFDQTRPNLPDVLAKCWSMLANCWSILTGVGQDLASFSYFVSRGCPGALRSRQGVPCVVASPAWAARVRALVGGFGGCCVRGGAIPDETRRGNPSILCSESSNCFQLPTAMTRKKQAGASLRDCAFPASGGRARQTGTQRPLHAARALAARALEARGAGGVGKRLASAPTCAAVAALRRACGRAGLAPRAAAAVHPRTVNRLE